MGRRKNEEARVLGPNKHPKGWRVTTIEPGANDPAKRRYDRYFGDVDQAQEIADYQREIFARRTSTPIRAALDDYERYLAVDKGNKPKSVAETLRRLRLFFPDGDLLLYRITPERAGEIYDAFVAGRSVDYHRNTLAEAKTFMRFCIARKWLQRNPFDDVEGKGKRKTGKDQLTGNEARRLYVYLLARADKDDAAVGCLMLLMMALRSSDVCKRVVRDVDLDGTVLRVTGSKTKKGDRPRVIPAVLQPLIAKRAAGRGPLEPLFATHENGFHTKSWLKAAMKRFCEAAKVPYVCPHGLKGTAGTLAVEAGALADQVADYLSHESATTTRRHYVDGGVAAAVEIERGLTVLQGGKR